MREVDARARACAEQAIERVELSVELSAADMERVVRALADMFAIGWHASGDRPARPLVDNPPRRARGADPVDLGRGRKVRR